MIEIGKEFCKHFKTDWALKGVNSVVNYKHKVILPRTSLTRHITKGYSVHWGLNITAGSGVGAECRKHLVSLNFS